MKKLIVRLILLFIILMFIYYNINYYYIYCHYLYCTYDGLAFISKNNIMYTLTDPHKSEVLNCVYISRYMGQDWNKKFLYFDIYGNLTDYCKNLIDNIKEELNKKSINDNNTKYRYYQYINNLILHARECIDITGNGDEVSCKLIEDKLEAQINIKKNVCLLDVDNELCNKQKINNSTPLINGYLDKNMINFGRNFYEHDRNYHIYQISKTNYSNDISIVNIMYVAVVGVGLVVYLMYK